MAGFHKETSATADSLSALGKAGSINNGKLDQGQGSTGTSPPCPECGSAKTWKDGIRETAFGPVQRYLCRSCGYRFSDPNSKQAQTLFNGSGMSEHVETIHTKKLKSETAILTYCRVSDELYERASTGQLRLVKSLAEVEARQENAQREGTTQTAEIKGKIVEFLWYLTKQGKSKYTIDNRKCMLETLVKFGANLLDPEDIKDKIAKYPGWRSPNSKMQAVRCYKSFASFIGVKWESPKYHQPESLPFIPLEKELDTLINASGKILGAFLQGLKDTGADPGELAAIEWIDINPQTKTLTLNHPVKGHNPRILKVSDEFLARINRLPKRNDGRVFANVRCVIANFTFQRKRIAHMHGNPRLLKITFRTFRHWKGTMEYHKTHDVYHVKKILGHKRLQSTEIYINLEQAVFTEQNDEFHVKAVKTIDEACKLLEVGFEYVTDMDDYKLFRKRK